MKCDTVSKNSEKRKVNGDTNFHSNEESRVNCDKESQNSVKYASSDVYSDSSSSVETESAEIDDNLEQLNESNGVKTSVDAGCSLKEESSETPSPETYTDSVGESCKRTRRSTKRKKGLEDFCPVCGVTIRCYELESHFTKEVENLSKLTKSIKKPYLGDEGVNTTYVRVKSNRENRLAAKVSKYSRNSTVVSVECPVCHLKLEGSEDERNEHVLNCTEEDSISDIDVINTDDNFEEYDFGGETRIRAISLVPGGYRTLYGHTSNSKPNEDNDEDLNVDVDDTLKYGKAQYSELDVIHNLNDAEDAKELTELRKAVIDPNAIPNVLETRKWSNASEENNEKSDSTSSLDSKDISEVDNKNGCTENTDKIENTVQDSVILSLKERITNLEQSKAVKCLICLESYTKPVVSTACWHVYCEECWLTTMGVKKLCPQCNMIVCPSDLRRIYL